MRVIDHVTRHGTRVNVALHAGELTPSLVPPEDASDHIRLAVELAGARRIGHAAVEARRGRRLRHAVHRHEPMALHGLRVLACLGQCQHRGHTGIGALQQ